MGKAWARQRKCTDWMQWIPTLTVLISCILTSQKMMGPKWPEIRSKQKSTEDCRNDSTRIRMKREDFTVAILYGMDRRSLKQATAAKPSILSEDRFWTNVTLQDIEPWSVRVAKTWYFNISSWETAQKFLHVFHVRRAGQQQQRDIGNPPDVFSA